MREARFTLRRSRHCVSVDNALTIPARFLTKPGIYQICINLQGSTIRANGLLAFVAVVARDDPDGLFVRSPTANYSLPLPLPLEPAHFRVKQVASNAESSLFLLDDGSVCVAAPLTRLYH